MTILFDLDDTLLDDNATKEYYLPRLFNQFNSLINSDITAFSANWISAIPKYYKLFIKGELTFQEQRAKRVMEAFNNDELTNENIQNILDAFDIHFANSWKLFDGWTEFFNQSKLPRSIVTNGNPEQQRAKIEKLQLDKYFDKVFISDEIGLSKPDSDIFQYVCNELKVLPENCIFIGDSWYYDIKGSSDFGMKAFWINHSGQEQPEPIPNLEVFNTIGNLISRLNEIELSLK